MRLLDEAGVDARGNASLSSAKSAVPLIRQRGRSAVARCPLPCPGLHRQCAEQDAFIVQLRQILNKPAQATEAVLMPPLYGQWYAAQSKLEQPAHADRTSR